MALTTSQCRKCRREGTKLFLKGEKCFSPKCPLIQRNYPPGAHGVKKSGRPTEYGQQLREKQKAKRIYGLREKQFRNYYQKAIKQKGDTGEILKQFLALRLDNIIFQANLASSRPQARQLVNHGFFLVNGKKVNIPSYQIKPKDEITIKPEKNKTKAFADLEKKLAKKEFPAWLHFNQENRMIKILNKPTGGELSQSFNPRLIVEFYSR